MSVQCAVQIRFDVLCMSHTLILNFTIADSEDILLTLVWEEITPTPLVMLTSSWVYELFVETNSAFTTLHNSEQAVLTMSKHYVKDLFALI